MTEQFFGCIEEEFGQQFVCRTLGYITAVKHGLSEVELLDILTSDKEVG